MSIPGELADGWGLWVGLVGGLIGGADGWGLWVGLVGAADGWGWCV